MKKQQMQRILLSGSAVFALSATATFAADKTAPSREQSVPMEIAVGGLLPVEQAEISAQFSNWLEQERPAGVREAAARIQISPDQTKAIEFPEPVNGEPLKAGVVVPITARIGLHALGSAKSPLPKGDGRVGGGTLAATREGGYVWATAITSTDAGGIRVHLINFSLPENAEMYFYSQWGEVYGPFTGVGPDGTREFWTPSVLGSEGILQLRVSGPVAKGDLQTISFDVTEVGHIGRGVFGTPTDGDVSVASFCPTNAACIENVNCGSHPVTNNAELAVAKMLWIAGPYIYTCSGGLIADTLAGQINYFLTANHCISKSSSNLEAFFGYQDSCGSTANCTGTWDDPPAGSFTGKTVGATIKKTGRRGDFSLFTLNQNPPAGSVFLGWNNTSIANSGGTPLYRVSHPSGAPQSYSDQTVNATSTTCTGWPRGERIYSNGVTGSMEGGSSGSPVLNSAGEIVGQLTGSCGTQGCATCNHTCKRVVDGAFAYYYSQVQPFLAP
jgi:V8-like Glu-specific endopeptidase